MQSVDRHGRGPRRGRRGLAAALWLTVLAGPLWGLGWGKRPNVLWIVIEDTCPLMSCYGVSINPTPNIDRLAQQGVRFDRAFTPHPVCSPARSALITGTYATTLGMQHHHSSRTVQSAIYLPPGVKTLPELFREAGYFTFNAGKDDYNFIYDRDRLYSGRKEIHFWYTFAGHPEDTWRQAARKKGQPFFGQIQLEGGKHVLEQRTETYHQALPPEQRIDRDIVPIPPYYPDHPVIREDWARHYDSVRITDREVGRILEQLEVDGLLKNTVVFFFADHGYKGVRHKQFCYDGGLRVPLLAMWLGKPKVIKPQTVREDLVSLLDVSATSLALAGIKIPGSMDGRNLFARNYRKRSYLIGARDRCDFTIDRIRSVRTDRFKYIRNFMTDRPLMQPNYRDTRPEYTVIRDLYAAGKLNPAQAQFWLPTRVPEELYDLKQDPDELVNLAHEGAYQDRLFELRKILADWIKRTGDRGQIPEGDSLAGREALRFMIERWGDRCVNPEYEVVRAHPVPGAPLVDIKTESP